MLHIYFTDIRAGLNINRNAFSLVIVAVAENLAADICTTQSIHDLADLNIRHDSSHGYHGVQSKGIAAVVNAVDGCGASSLIQVLPGAE